MLRQILAVCWMNLRNLPARSGSSAVIVIGIGGVVGVMVALLAMSAGFKATLDRGGAPDRAIVLRGGADSELSSGIGTEEAIIVGGMEGVAQASAELYTVANVPKRSTGVDANVIVRGVSPSAFDIRDEVEIVAGRRFERGRQEVIAGRAARTEFAGVNVGSEIPLRGSSWTIVGLFAANGSAYESELWVDLPVAQSAFRFGAFVSSMRLGVESPARIPELAERVRDDPRLDLEVRSEAAHYANQSGELSETIETFGYAVATIMAIGAAFAALNTMYSAVVARTVEIATLRALGFGNAPVLISVMIESMALALAGGVLGAAVSYLAFNGFTVSTLNNASFSQVAFDFAVTPQVVRTGLVWALALGAVGGLFPALRASSLTIADALRGE